ncbi:MAG: hypothetical protein ISP71_07410 [Flavobacteriales bacterium]|nr:hypothetical protein [Flavobacteriales bacterium]
MKIYNYLRFFCSSSFYHSLSVISYLKSNDKTDVFLYYPQHFSFQSNYPLFLSPLIESIEKNGLSSIVIEEPNIDIKNKRSKDVMPFDFIWFLVIVLRKFYKGKNYSKIDVKIGKLLSKFFGIRRDVKNIITVSQSFQSIFKGMFPKAVLYDYQHGLISSKYYGYINGNSVAEHILKNQSNVLLYGQGFRNKLLSLDGGEYFKEHSFVIGSIYKEYSKPKLTFNGNILYTLQFTKSHSKEFNELLLNKTIECFDKIKSHKLDIVLFLKEHPRFENCLSTDVLYEYDFVKCAPHNLDDCFELCSLHMTEYSSVLFDSLRAGIPTVLTAFTKEMSIYENEYHFPSDEMSIIEKFKQIKDDSFYKNMISKQIKWSKVLYEPFNEKHFIEVIK